MKAIIAGNVGNISKPALPGDVGFNLHIADGVWLEDGEQAWLATEVRVKCPDGTYARIVGRSSSNRRKLIVREGTIDNGFTGELFVCVKNASGIPQRLEAGDAIAQLIFAPAMVPELVIGEMPETERGENKWGSTNKS